MKRIAIASSNKWVGKVQEDIWLQEELQNRGIRVDLVDWNNIEVAWSNYQAVILRSIWGYHRTLRQFKNWLTMLDKINIPMYNSTNIVRWNMYKDLQLDFFKNNQLAMIPSVVIKENEILNYSNNIRLSKDQSLVSVIKSVFTDDHNQFVIKPTVSASGENTYVISDNEDFKRSISINEGEKILEKILSNNPTHGAIIQPFIPEITKGELSFVYFNKKLSHVVLRYPGVLVESQQNHEVYNYLKTTKALVNNVMIKLAEKDILYARVDVVETSTGPLLMELELIEPVLLLRDLTESRRKEAINMLTSCVLNRL